MYDTAFFLQVNHIFMKKKISLSKESSNFAIVSFQMLKLPVIPLFACAALYLYHLVFLVYLPGSFKENHFQMFLFVCSPNNPVYVSQPLGKSSGSGFF